MFSLRRGKCYCGSKFGDDNIPLTCTDCHSSSCKDCLEVEDSQLLQCRFCYASENFVRNFLLKNLECCICLDDDAAQFHEFYMFKCGHGVCYFCLEKQLGWHQDMAKACDDEDYECCICGKGGVQLKLLDLGGSNGSGTKCTEMLGQEYHVVWWFDMRKLANNLVGSISKDKIPEAIVEYKRFMFLKKRLQDFSHPFLISPPPIVDVVWHKHILDTKNYMDFCERCIGHMVHHDPAGERDSSKKFERLKRFFEDYIKIFKSTSTSLAVDEIFSNFLKEQDKKTDNSLYIFVKLLTGQSKTFYITPDTVVWELKLKIFIREGLGISQQRLIFCGRELLNVDEKLANYNIHCESQLHLMLRLTGC